MEADPRSSADARGSMSLALPILAALAAVAATWLMTWLHRHVVQPWSTTRRFRAQGVPGYPFRPVVGQLPELIQTELARESKSTPGGPASGKATQFFFDGTEQYGKVWSWSLGRTVRLMLVDPILARHMLVSQAGCFQKLPALRSFRLLGQGLVALEGQQWAHQRALLSPAFHVAEIKRMFDTMARHAAEAVDSWSRTVAANPGSPLAMDKELRSLTLRIICTTAFGMSLDESRLSAIQAAFEEVVTRDGEGRVMAAVLPFYQRLPTAGNRAMWRSERFVVQEMRAIIANRLSQNAQGGFPGQTAGEAKGGGSNAEPAFSPPLSAERVDLLQLMLSATQGLANPPDNNLTSGGTSSDSGRGSTEHWMSQEQLMHECLTFLGAGHETTAALLQWTMLLLSQHPDWQQRARDEVLAMFSSQDASWTPGFDSLAGLKTVTMVLQEALRLYPPAPALARLCVQDTVLGEGGPKVPAGCEVLVPVEVLHQMEELWGAEATEFNPQRFADGASKAPLQPGAYVPFGLGPRVCIGQNFAMVEARLVLALILRRFSWVMADTYRHYPTVVVSTTAKYGMPVVLTPLT